MATDQISFSAIHNVLAGFLYLAFDLQPPQPESPTGNMVFWTYLPFIACLTFGFVILIGVLIILRENRRINLQRMAEEEPPLSDLEDRDHVH